MNTVKMIRAIHRDVGFFFVGMMLIYAISGVVLVYRTGDFLKVENERTVVVAPQLTGANLNDALRLKGYKLVNETESSINFGMGTYDKATGKAVYTESDYIFPLDKMARLHKVNDKSPAHWMGVLSGIALLILAITSFWMYPKKSRQFRRGIAIIGVGILFALLGIAIL